MKKTMILGAAALAATMAMGVESSVVGYKQFAFDEENEVYAQNIGLCFQQTTADGNVTIEDSYFGRDVENNDKIYLFNQDYDMNDIYQFKSGVGWAKTVFTWDGSERSTIASFTIPGGAAVGVEPADPTGTIAVSGKVAESGTQVMTFQMDEENEIYSFYLVNPYPIATTIADVANLANVNNDVIRVYNAEYDMYDFYQFKSGVGFAKTVFTWDGSVRSTIPTSEFATTTLMDVGQGAIFTPADETLRTWSVTYEY